MSHHWVVTSGALLLFVLVPALAGHAQVRAGAGLVHAVDVARNSVTVETRAGLRSVLVPPTATIQDDHGNPLRLGDIRPGDAITYQVVSGALSRLHVGRQFWAIPDEPAGSP